MKKSQNEVKDSAFNPFNAEATDSQPKYKNAKNFENRLNPVMLVFIG